MLGRLADKSTGRMYSVRLSVNRENFRRINSMTKFEQVGVNMQYDSETKEVAQQKFSRSCECCCCKGMQIKCDNCAIETAHKLVMASFENKED